MKPKAKWQKDELERLAALPDSKLLEEVLDMAGGDDWDGCFTTRGRWSFEQAKEELYKRLPATWGPNE